VATGSRRQGLGRQLLYAAEERLREAGAVRAQANVVETNTLATRFWTTSGWEQQSERLRFVKG
jgi:ribosomal protein S18 acetylase RimI-like enzyme